MAEEAAAAPKQQGKKGAEGLDIKDLLKYFASKWYWFVISVAICVAYQAYHVMRITPTYSRTIQVLFKNDASTGSGTAAIPDLSVLGISTRNMDLANEMITIRSADMMAEVVESLDLNNSYYVKDGLQEKLLYKTSPILVQNMLPPDKQMESAYSFTITLKSPDTYIISDFKGPGAPEKNVKLRARTGTTIKTPFGLFKVTTTTNFTPEYIDKPVKYSHQNVMSLASSLSKKITYKLAEYSSSIVDLSIRDSSPMRAEDILNTLIDVYNQRWLAETNQQATSTSEFINERLAVIEGELGDVEENISSYKSANLISDGGSDVSTAVSTLAQTQSAKIELNNRISLVKYLRREVQNAPLDRPLPNPAGIEGTSVEAQLAQYNATVMERNRMLATSSESNPLVQDRTITLETLRNTMVESIDNLLLSLNVQLRTLDQQEAKSTSQIVRNPTQAKYLLSVERQQKVKESLYLFLLQKREENELSQTFAAYNTRIISKPSGPAGPVAPNKQDAIMSAAGIGLAIPLVILFLIKTMDTRVHGRRDLQGLTLPFLGEIPLHGKPKSWWQRKFGKSEDESVRPIMVRPKSRNAINEAFRVLRSNLEFMGGTFSDQLQGMRVIMVTSMYPGSGKTFVALNLAATLALKGKKVVMIDLDMRKGTMSHIVGQGRKGISNYVAGQAPLQDIIVRDVNGIPGLNVIPVGAIPPNPSEMLYSHRFEEMILQLKEENDFVIIDCPPVEIVADTQIISRFVDMTIFVIRVGLFERSDLSRLQELYDSKRFKNLAVVLNGVMRSGLYYRSRKYNTVYAGYIHEDQD